MNNRGRLLTLGVVLSTLLVLVVGSAQAGSNKTYFTANETPLRVISPGEESFPDGRYNLRGGEDIYTFVASDPRLDNAEDDVTINWNFKFMPEPVYVAGQMWGTFVITNDGGSWEGIWTGMRAENGYSYFHFVGSGGRGYKGMQLRMWGERLDPDPTLPEIYHGYIIEPGG
jgi:hypothetical protein